MLQTLDQHDSFKRNLHQLEFPCNINWNKSFSDWSDWRKEKFSWRLNLQCELFGRISREGKKNKTNFHVIDFREYYYQSIFHAPPTLATGDKSVAGRRWRRKARYWFEALAPRDNAWNKWRLKQWWWSIQVVVIRVG